MRLYKKRAALLMVSISLGLGLVLAPVTNAISIGGPSDCDNNAIIKCGAHSTAELMNAYNSSAYVQKVFTFFGISAADMADLPNTAVAGKVMKDGRVFVDGQSRAVATSAVTGGRQNIAGSTKVNFGGITFFKRPPSVSFQQESLPAFVAMKNGKFQFAVIASCGNAVRAVPTTPPPTSVGPAKPVSKPKPQSQPPKPAPTPPPAPSQSQQQQQSVTQNVTQNQQVTVNSESSAQATAPTPPQEVAATTPTQPPTSSETTTAAAPQTSTETVSNLPNVGTGGTVGVFVVSTLLGTLGYRRYLLHMLNG